MEWSKDIRYPEKKVDSAWKEAVEPPSIHPKKGSTEKTAPLSQQPAPKTSKIFINLLSSIGFQTLLHLGEVPESQGGTTDVNLDAARETISVLIALRDKTAGNLSPEEKEMMNELISELQMKFAAKA